MGAKVEFPIGKQLFHLVINPGTSRCPTADLELVQIWNTTFRSEIPSRKTGPPFYIFHFIWEFSSLPRRRLRGSSFFIPPHKHLLNRRRYSFPKLGQSHCTSQILESWPWPWGNLIFTRSAWNTGKAFWPLINVRFRAAKIRFSQILQYSMYYITLAKERKEGKR